MFFVFKQKRADEKRSSDCSSDVCSSDLLVAALKPRGECEFIDEFAKVLPINVFLTMMGLPLDDRAFLLPRAEIAVRSNDVELKTKTQMELAGYLMGHIEDRKANRRDDLLGMIGDGEVEERLLTPHEIMALSLPGLDGGPATVDRSST